MQNLTCLSIDDDPMFHRKLEMFIEDIPWLSLLSMHKNPVQGATAIIKEKPDVVFCDMEMPYIDGNYILDWLTPKLNLMDKKPKIIFITSLAEDAIDEHPDITGYINKAKINSPEELEDQVRAILGG